MAYEPTNWKSGDVVTSAKLNKIEQGIAGIRFIEVVQTTDVVSEDCAIVQEQGANVAYVENWVTLLRNPEAFNHGFTVTVTYEDSEGVTNVDVAEIPSFADDNSVILYQGGSPTTLYSDEEDDRLFMVVSAPQWDSGGNYTHTNLGVMPRRAKSSGTVHVDVEAVELLARTEEFDIAYNLV